MALQLLRAEDIVWRWLGEFGFTSLVCLYPFVLVKYFQFMHGLPHVFLSSVISSRKVWYRIIVRHTECRDVGNLLTYHLASQNAATPESPGYARAQAQIRQKKKKGQPS